MVMRKKFGWVPGMSSLKLFKVDGDRPHIVTYPQDKVVSNMKYLVTFVGALQVRNRYAKMNVVVEKLICMSDLFCASIKQKCNVGNKSGLLTTIVMDDKYSGTFQDVGSGMQIGMINEEVQIDILSLLNDDLGDGF